MKSKVYRVATDKCGKSNIESSQSDRLGRRRLRGRKSQLEVPGWKYENYSSVVGSKTPNAGSRKIKSR